ncbi:MAG TPA: DUF302 domain-containing protein [Dehalococcoidia bacterium]|nr:DUF302 domain-containing protein [Dehalococcoidia bacterium]
MQKIHGGLTAQLDGPFEDVIPSVRDALKAEGFGILTEIDVQATLKEKIGADVPPHLILGACNPHLAHAAIQADPDISLLLPCNVTVRQEGTGVVVSIVDPDMMAEMSSAPELPEIAKTAKAKLQRVITALAAK